MCVEFELPDGGGLGLFRREAFARHTGQVPETVAEGSLSATELYFHADDLAAAVSRMQAAGARVLPSLGD